MSILQNVLTNLGQGGGSTEAASVSKSLIGDKNVWRKRLEEEERKRQEAIAAEEAKQARKFSTYEVGEGKNKTVFGHDVSGLIPGKRYDKTYSVKVTDKVADVDPKEFIKQFDNMNKDAQKIYVNGIKAKVQGYEENAGKKFEELKKQGKSDKEAQAEIAKTFGDDYYAAINTIKTLDKEGKFKGNFMDFIEGANDKLYGGITRSAIRTGYWLKGDSGAAEDVIKRAGQGDNGGEFTSYGKAGEKFGSVEKGVVDVGAMITGAGAVDKLAKGSRVAQFLANGGKLSKGAEFILTKIPGSVVATGIDAQQELGRGNDVNLGRSTAIGLGVDVGLPVVGKLFKYTDRATGKTVEKMITKNNIDEVTRSIKNIGDEGLIGGLNKNIADAGRSVTYKASDLLGKTKAGAKVIDLKDDFMTKWVTEMHPLYKALKRSDFEGKTDGAYLAAREAIGNSNRALSYAQDYIDNSPAMREVTDGLESRGKDLVKIRKNFDEFAKVKSELDLAAAGKKQFSKKKMAELEERFAKFGKDGFDKEYEGLTKFYKELNDFRLENGLISKEQYDNFADEGFDYVRQQRELPDWMLDKPATKGRGSTASITKSEAVQKRNKYASAELLSPMETALKTAQLAHVEAYRNKAAKTIYGLLDQAGEAKLVRSTDLVREKQALLTALKDSKPLVQKLNKTLRTNKNAAGEISKEMTALRAKGRNELSKEMNQFIADYNKKLGRKADAVMNPRQTMEFLTSLDNKELRKIRRMLESRNSKLEPLLDKIELLNRDLSDLHAERSGIWNQAMATKTTVNKSGMTSLSFLDDGVENVVKIDPVVASAIHNWDKQQQNVMNEVLRFSNNVFKYGTTGANAGFALPNFVADQVGSAINSKNIMATHNPVNFVHSLFMTLGKPLNAQDAEIMRAFTMGNAGQTTINQYTKRATADKAVNKLARRNAKLGTKAYTILRHPKEAMRSLFDATEGAVALTENLTRTQNFRGVYKRAVKEGLEENAGKLANQAARENSVDFLEMGSYGRVINSLIPYFNAGIQGNRTLLRNAAERPVSFMAKTTALVGVPMAATTIWNTEDPKRKAIYDTIPDYVKETNFIVIGPNAKWNEDKGKYDGVFLMKKPPGFKEFAEPVRKFIEYKADQGDGSLADFLKEQGGSVAADFGQTFSPIDFSSPNKFLSSVTPQILKPTAEAILNKNFFQGTDIVGDWMKDLEPKDQKYEHYSQLTSHIAAMFNTSPLKVDHWIRATFGEVGTNAQNVIDRATGASPEATGGRSLQESITRRFYGAPGGNDADTFYEAYNPAYSARTRASKQVTELVKAGKINEAKRRAEEYNNSIADRFKAFKERYSDSPTYDEKWDERIKELEIPITYQSFRARARQE